MKNVTLTLAATLLLGSTAARTGSDAKAKNKALAEEYLRQVYAQVGETYLAQTETDASRRRRRRVIKKEEYKTYENLYPPAEGAMAKLRGDPWPCSEKEPCGEGEGTCMNPYEIGSHPDALCAEPFFCQDRVGGSRGGKGEAVLGVEFTGALKMHHMGANDICYDEEWETYGAPNKKMAVLRRKMRPCTEAEPCDVGEGDCNNNDKLCNEGLSCAFRADDQVGAGEPLHGIEFTGDLLQNSDGANDLCYNPHWPNNLDAEYEGKVVRSCDQGGNNCEADVYLVLDGIRRHIPTQETFNGLWPGPEVVISKPKDAFKDIPISEPLCNMAPLIKGEHSDENYFVVDGKKRLVANTHTFNHLQFKESAVQTIPQCAIDAIEDGITIDYEGEGGNDEEEGPIIDQGDDTVKGKNPVCKQEKLTGIDKDADYRGLQTQTKSGLTCQAWSQQSPHGHSRTPLKNPDSGLVGNYCRNPDGEKTIWCYTTDPKVRWQYCDPKCVTCEDEKLTGIDKDADYRGLQTQTRSGLTCQAWSQQSPHGHSRTAEKNPNSGLVDNYCRNPDGEKTIWCYTTDPKVRWQYCDPIKCNT